MNVFIISSVKLISNHVNGRMIKSGFLQQNNVIQSVYYSNMNLYFDKTCQLDGPKEKQLIEPT